MSELELLRRSYEESLSWRITAPLRMLKRRVTEVRERRGGAATLALPAPPRPGERYDTWLTHIGGERLAAIDAACDGAGPEAYALFRELDVDLWAMLLTREYDAFPHIRALLPDMPGRELQIAWNGAAGPHLANQSKTFYAKVSERVAEHGAVPLSESRVLDFGIGWGRLARLFARDVAPGALHGCDPVDAILDVCRTSRVPATLTRTEFLPESLPYDEPFDLAYAFSIFTHTSERASEVCLDALHGVLNPGGLLVMTIRPPEWLTYEPLMAPVLPSLGHDRDAALAQPRFLFVPHAAEASHPQYEDGEMTYGETVITLPWLRERLAGRFEVLSADVLIGDLYQVMVTLRRI